MDLLDAAIFRLARRNLDFRHALRDEIARTAQSEAFRPPKGIAAAVHDGKLPAQVLLIWKYVAEKMGDHFDYGGAVAYWRSKCKKEGIDLPPEFLTGLGGKGVTANFPHKTGEQIEDWVRARLKSEGLLAEAGQTAAEVGLSITSIEQKIREAKTRVEQHMRGIEMGEKVTQRKKWLAKAQEELVALERQLEEARRGVTVVEEAAQRHEEHHAPSVSFEEQFQKLLAEATREMSQQQVLDKVLRSLAEFNAGLKATESPAHVAAIGDLWGVLERAWDKIKGVVAGIGRWAKGLFSSATKLNDLLDKAGA